MRKSEAAAVRYLPRYHTWSWEYEASEASSLPPVLHLSHTHSAVADNLHSHNYHRAEWVVCKCPTPIAEAWLKRRTADTSVSSTSFSSERLGISINPLCFAPDSLIVPKMNKMGTINNWFYWKVLCPLTGLWPHQRTTKTGWMDQPTWYTTWCSNWQP